MLWTRDTLRSVGRYLTAVVEVVDARAPRLTRHPALSRWVGGRPVVLVLNKADLADPVITEHWLRWFLGRGEVAAAVALSARAPETREKLGAQIAAVHPPPYRLAVVGAPNVGKSTLLNTMVGRHTVRVGARPGVTRGPQWVRTQPGWEWLDLPGTLAPSQSRDWRLKALGVASGTGETSVDTALALADAVPHLVPGWQPGMGGAEALWQWGRRRGFLRSGGALDEQRTADAFLSGFQQGQWGPVSLEAPEE
ncbi:MAG: 50S ribosome-binding GTPase [Firmicutes bacterium]|nr:50S ribosome-binding GTPase [Alicyclobacillaceae bacterium]MCL6496360.1 50S ribosome-binding GTPase [Bacillota bacterium]